MESEHLGEKFLFVLGLIAFYFQNSFVTLENHFPVKKSTFTFMKSLRDTQNSDSGFNLRGAGYKIVSCFENSQGGFESSEVTFKSPNWPLKVPISHSRFIFRVLKVTSDLSDRPRSFRTIG